MFQIETLLFLSVLIILVYLWQENLRVRESVIRLCKQTCQQGELQFLDETVSLASVAIKRTSKGLQLNRMYSFEISQNGMDRFTAYADVIGEKIISIYSEGEDENLIFYQTSTITYH